jgi:hypothetical protein
MEPTPDEPVDPSVARKDRRKRPSTPVPDMGIATGDHKFKVESRESRLEIVARLQVEKAKVDHDLRKDFALFLVVMAIVSTATVACLFIVLSNRYPPVVQNAAMALLAAIVSGGVGYATGKSSR